MAQGSFTARVYTSQNAIPVPGATVLLTRAGTAPGQTELIAVQVTDESGMTERILLDTPEKANSQQPEGGIGWSEITVSAEHPLYERIIVEHVQIFPGVETIQDFQLIPLAALPEVYNRTEIFEVQPQNL